MKPFKSNSTLSPGVRLTPLTPLPVRPCVISRHLMVHSIVFSYVLSPTFSSMGIGAVMPYENGNDHLSFLRPFSPKMWLFFWFLWVFYSLVLTLVSFVGKKFGKTSRMKEIGFSFFQSFWFFSLVAVQFGVSKQPKSLPGKILTLAWSFFTLVMIASYTANLAANFAKDVPIRPLKSIRDIPISRYEIAIRDGYLEYLRSSNNGILNSLLERKKVDFSAKIASTDDPRFFEQIKEKIAKGFIWVDNDNVIEWLIKEIPRLYKLEGSFRFEFYSLAMRPEWPMVSAVNDQFEKFAQNGFFFEIHQKYETKKIEQEGSDLSIKVDEYMELFVVMIVISLVAFLMVLFSYLHQVASKSNLSTTLTNPKLPETSI